MLIKSLLKHLASINKHDSFYLFKNSFASTSIKKPFYKNVSIVKTESDRYEIILDKRKLKTPKGNIFYVQSEALASMIAVEWDSQKDKILFDRMHLTTLTNTVIDNPGNLNKETFLEKLISYLEFDTICYRTHKPEELFNIQSEKLDPIVQWFVDQFDCSIPVTNSVVLPEIDGKTKNLIRKYLNSFNIWSMVGLMYAAENLKSLILTCALVNRRLSIKEAVKLSRIEENFQTSIWKSIEYHHDLEQYNLETRVAAAVIFILLNLEKNVISQKLMK